MLLWNEKGSKDFQGGHPFKHILLTSDFPKREDTEDQHNCALSIDLGGSWRSSWLPHQVCSVLPWIWNSPGGMHYAGDQEIAMMCEVDLLRLPVLMVSGLRTPYTVCRTTSEIYSYLTESVERSGPLGSRAIWNASRSIDTSGWAWPKQGQVPMCNLLHCRGHGEGMYLPMVCTRTYGMVRLIPYRVSSQTDRFKTTVQR